jgi:PPOX class probable F420-dependent enzyme
MDTDKAREFLSQHHRSILVTHRADGSPQTSPVVHALGADGRVMISTQEPRAKAHNIRRDPAISLCAFTDAFFGPWLQIDGRATIISLPEAMGLLVETYRLVAGEHEDWDDYRATMVRDRRCIISIEIDRASGPAAS